MIVKTKLIKLVILVVILFTWDVNAFADEVYLKKHIEKAYTNMLNQKNLALDRKNEVNDFLKMIDMERLFKMMNQVSWTLRHG